MLFRSWGAWEIAARIGELDVDNDAFPVYANPANSATKAFSWGVGLNWHLNRNVKVNLNYDQTDFKGGAATDLLRKGRDPETFLRQLSTPGFAIHDQWQVQVQAQIQRKARVYVKADGLMPAQLRAAWLEPIDDVARCVASRLAAAGPGARLAVLPQGPQTIPYVLG